MKDSFNKKSTARRLYFGSEGYHRKRLRKILVEIFGNLSKAGQKLGYSRDYLSKICLKKKPLTEKFICKIIRKLVK